MSNNIVSEWLLSLHLGQYAESFIDNGYDDLEICKQVGDPDLDAIGVLNPVHRSRLLESVRTLREEGAASIYFTLEESTAIHDECLCDNASAQSSHTTSSGRCSEKGSAASACINVAGDTVCDSNKYVDEYEEGKAELVKIPRLQLKILLRENLNQDGIRLSCQPYSTTDGERGYLEGLASRYADLFSTHYGDVLGHLEDLRQREWSEMSPRDRTPTTPGTTSTNYNTNSGTPTSGLTSSQSQPIYVPGKYSPSSCLSDKEEDEIYGFGYGVFGAQIARQQQQRLLGTQQQQQPVVQQNYQTCLSPRSAYFYEFPPNDQNYSNTNKKKTTFSRFLRGLKTSHRKEKHGSSSPRHGRAASRGVPQRVDTPDSVLQSGLGLTDLGQHAVLRSMVDPRDYDRLKYFQMNGGAPNTFEETIHRILRDIREGLLQLGKEGYRGPLTCDDTYMYDEDVRVMAPTAHGHDRGHWYDEPPYESDPEDFLMGSSPGPTATIQNGRVCFTLNQRQESRGEGVISLRTAGDISLPRDIPCASTPRGAPRRGLILPQAGHPPTIIPLTHSRSARDRESGDYAGSDIQSISSRLSTLSVDTSRSDQPDFHDNKTRQYRKLHNYRNEECLSPSQSSDYEDQDDFENCSQQIGTVHVSSDGRSTGVCTLVGKVRGLRHDVQRKISKLRNESLVEQEKRADQAFPCSASSIESLPSGSGSSTQALVRVGSNHSSISVEDVDSSPADPQIIGRARALVEYTPSPYDKDALKFKKGDIIDILSMNASGQWKGICHGKKGTFKFINVELLSERAIRNKKEMKWHRNIVGKPTSVEELLRTINMQEHISVFVLNGYEDLELFKEIEPSDLDYLGIINSEHRAKILTAVQFLHDLDSGSEGDVAGSSSEGDEHNKCRIMNVGGTCSPFERRQFPRDSGCYDASLKSSTKVHHISPQDESDTSDNNGFCDTTNNLDSVVEQCNNEILARVRQAQKNVINLKEEAPYQPNITNLPNSSSADKIQQKAKDTYVGIHGQTTLIDPCRRNLLNRGSYRKNTNIEDSCEADQKLTTVKYVVGANNELSLGEGGNTGNMAGRGGCLSEKSSDSGVSSSSLSSANHKDGRQPTLSQNENLIRGVNNFSSCANRTTSNAAK
uniref:Sterile alpha motif domain-containing protein 5 n=1 Tax=Photinus pyralis TaxID=7054 RepID=A0A1Y1LAL0_PHOPY